jgi:hypothetical protein
MEMAVVVVLRRKRLWLCRFTDCCAGQEDGVECGQKARAPFSKQCWLPHKHAVVSTFGASGTASLSPLLLFCLTNKLTDFHHRPVDHHAQPPRRVTIDVVATIDNNTTPHYTACHCCRRPRTAFPAAAARCPRLPPPGRCTTAAPSSVSHATPSRSAARNGPRRWQRRA